MIGTGNDINDTRAYALAVRGAEIVKNDGMKRYQEANGSEDCC
jgi:hypothetical protein